MVVTTRSFLSAADDTEVIRDMARGTATTRPAKRFIAILRVSFVERRVAEQARRTADARSDAENEWRRLKSGAPREVERAGAGSLSQRERGLSEAMPQGASPVSLSQPETEREPGTGRIERRRVPPRMSPDDG